MEEAVTELNLTILYVADAAASDAFYADLFGRAPVEASPNFAMFIMPSGARLGLWSRHDVKPAITVPAGAGEIVFYAKDAGALAVQHADWAARGLTIAQAPVELDFGATFVALDPDGHRLRVMLAQ